MRILINTFILAISCSFCLAQSNLKLDSLKVKLTRVKSDTTRVLIYEKLMNAETIRQKKIEYGLKGYELAKRIRYNKGTILCGNQVAWQLSHEEYYRAIPIFLETKRLAELTNDKEALANALGGLGYSYGKLDSNQGMSYYDLSKNLIEKEKISNDNLPIYLLIGMSFKEDNKYQDSALFYLNKSYQLAIKSPSYSYTPNNHLRHFGHVYYNMGEYDLALDYFKKSIASNTGQDQFSNYYIALILRSRKQLDSAKLYAQKSLKEIQVSKPSQDLIHTTTLLSELYEKDNPAKALRYLRMANAAKDSLFRQDKVRQVDKLAFEVQNREASIKRRIEAHEADFQNQIKIYILFGVLIGLSILAFLLYRNNRNKQKANHLLHSQKEEIDSQRNKAENALKELKSTQAQLIQSEKMASLGELTAGIAHEIQNPLNFVNNFSEVSEELLTELKVELDKGDIEEAKALSNDVIQNLQKINHHGQRASSIVKGMLEHSRTSSGKKELTDINALADEYLRLAYHGLRAKDKNFQADFKTDLDPNLPNIEVVQQDIGRVLLNLINNAFQAVNEHSLSVKPGYKPVVIVSTKQLTNNQLLITITDNGPGIPDAIKDKIFQPFFTTKDTGKGTGLGLSLAYDIVKAHGGTLEVESVEGEGTEFIIQIPYAEL